MEPNVFPYAALVLMLSAVTMAVRLNSGGLFIFHFGRVTGGFGVLYRTYLALILVTAPVLVGALVAAYWLLDWRTVLGLQLGFTLLGMLMGAVLWRLWVKRSARAPVAETAVFYALAVIGAAGLLVDLATFN